MQVKGKRKLLLKCHQRRGRGISIAERRRWLKSSQQSIRSSVRKHRKRPGNKWRRRKPLLWALERGIKNVTYIRQTNNNLKVDKQLRSKRQARSTGVCILKDQYRMAPWRQETSSEKEARRKRGQLDDKIVIICLEQKTLPQHKRGRCSKNWIRVVKMYLTNSTITPWKDKKYKGRKSTSSTPNQAWLLIKCSGKTIMVPSEDQQNGSRRRIDRDSMLLPNPKIYNMSSNHYHLITFLKQHEQHIPHTRHTIQIRQRNIKDLFHRDQPAVSATWRNGAAPVVD